MAKLDKSQQNYALGRVDQLYGEAYRKLSKTTEVDHTAIAAALVKKGFIVTNDYRIGQHVQLPKTAKEVAAEEARKQKIKDLHAASNEAKDQIMLGDSDEVTKILADLAKKLGE